MRILTLTLLTLLLEIGSAWGAFVTPKIGGAQVGSGSEDPQLMIHVHVSYDSSTSSVNLGIDPGTAELRPLEPPDEFDPAEPWGVLGTKAYNFQYGWLASGFEFPPVGAWFWMEQLSATPGLEVYQRPPATPQYAPIFGTAGSSPRWRWSGQMTHNVYAVQDPSFEFYEAEYRVYIGNDTTGEPLAGYTAAEITLQFGATPVLLADFDEDDDVDAQDFVRWEGDFGTNGDSDANGDGDSDGFDLLVWQREFGKDLSPPQTFYAIPEPMSAGLVTMTVACFCAMPCRLR